MRVGKKTEKRVTAQVSEVSPNSASTKTQVPGASFPIVGIGASAGGLAAIEAFFSGMPTETESGMAFVLVQHLAPDHKSVLTELVRRYTRMDVFEVEDGMVVKPNCAYIIPPNRDMAFVNGALQLLEPVAPQGHRATIDFFFQSLARNQRERAICIVLSGTGSDGTLGLRAIKAAGGMAMVQDPESAGYDGMPCSASATGLVDYTLPPAEMPMQLMAYAAEAFGGNRKASNPSLARPEDALRQVFVLLRSRTGHDLSQYKRNTIERRVERRMAVQHIQQLDEYLRYLREAPEEIDALFRDLLIGVTSFFRDPAAFKALEQHIATMLASKPGETIRVWTAGCSTGEEAYSLAILIREQMDTLKRSLKLQLFATDIDSRAVEAARKGVYPASIAADVSPERLARFFSAEGGSYRINKSIRDTLIFSEHDVIRDPPFSNLDLISCRNLLIYMGDELQRKLFPLFHYALKPRGLLFLGASETTSDFLDLYATLDRKLKLYQRKDVHGAAHPALAKFVPRPSEGAKSPPEARATRATGKLTLRELTERALLRRAPISALVDEQGNVLYLHGHTGKYLQLAPGEAGLSITKMALEDLRHDLAAALHRAMTYKTPAHCRQLRVKTNGAFTTVDLTVEPVSASSTSDESHHFLVLFEELAVENAGLTPNSDPASEVDQRIAELNRQLKARDASLETTREQCETANHELKSSNEELQSTNEELQSTNEELETSKEELQSVNEELATVNTELQFKVVDLSRANNDMNNLLAGTGVGTIFVDHDLRVQRFTPAVTQLINLIRTDAGRPLAHIASNLMGYDRLVLDVKEVLESLVPREVEVKTGSGAWFLLKIRPYRTLENVIDGAVITFTDITTLKAAQAALLEVEALRQMAAVMRDAHDGITVQELGGQIRAWNRGATRMYGFTEAEALTMNIQSLVPAEHREEALEMVRRLTRAEVLAPFRMKRICKNAQIKTISLTATALVNELGEIYAVATTERELKEQTHA